MGGPYLVLLALAGLGLALGWRLTSAPERGDSEGLPRLLQLGIAATGLVVIALLMVPFFLTIESIECTPEAEQAGACLIGVKERGLFGGAAFACLVGVAFAFVLRKGVLDFPDSTQESKSKQADESEAVERAAAVVAQADADEDEGHADEGEGAEVLEDGPAPSKPQVEPEPEPEPAPEPKPEPATEPEPEPEPKPSSHRRLEGPVFQAFVDDKVVDLEAAIATAAERLHSERVAVVFSRGASKDANEALLELAKVFDAYRYVLEGTAAATEGLTLVDRPNPHEADELAGPDARHAMQLALDLAGGLIETVFLLDTRVAFPEFVLGQLTVLQSVCIAHAHDDVSAACQVVLPGTNPGEREGELIDSGGGTNDRRPRAWLVERLVASLRGDHEPSAEATDPPKVEPAEPEASEPAESKAEAAEPESKTDAAEPVESKTEAAEPEPAESKTEAAEPESEAEPKSEPS